jgi:hypothetical protein
MAGVTENGTPESHDTGVYPVRTSRGRTATQRLSTTLLAASTMGIGDLREIGQST